MESTSDSSTRCWTFRGPHEVDWSRSREAVRRSIQTIRAATGKGREGPEIEALVQAVVVTDDVPAAAQGLTELIPGASVDDLLEAPFIWIGTLDEIASKLQTVEGILGISRYVIRPPAMTDARLVIDTVTGGTEHATARCERLP